MLFLSLLLTVLANILPNLTAFSIPDSKSSTSVGSRIINGQLASSAQFPSQVSILTRIDNYEPFVEAGGSLISKDYVLTVAHAVKIDGVQFIEVHFGVLERFNPDEERVNMTVNKDGFIVHEDFHGTFVRFADIALLKLPQSVEFTDKIQPIALPTRADANINMEGSILRVAGWGRFSDASQDASQYLQYTDLVAVSPKICQHYYPEFQSSMLCASVSLGTATCAGDSGGAVVYTDPATNCKFVAGMVSYGFYTCLDDGFPKAFTRITSYLDWIAEHSDIVIL